jgi:hypothetical protein
MSSVPIRAEIMPCFLRYLCPQNELFDNFRCSKKSSGRKGVQFGRNTYLHWNYNLAKNLLNSEGVKLEMSHFCVDLTHNSQKKKKKLKIILLRKLYNTCIWDIRMHKL